jgi:putative DNA primase/helicase
MEGVRRVLYRLPEVIKAQAVVVVEGEKDADRLKELGFTATTTPEGAGKWPGLEQDWRIGDPLHGKEVFVLPDNDEPGHKHASQVASSLYGKAKVVKVIHLSVLPDKGDVSDFIAIHGPEKAVEMFSELFKRAPAWKPPASQKQVQSITDIILSAENFTRVEIERKETLLNPWLREQSINLISGFRGIGKTWVALSILDAVTRGESFGPWAGGDPVPCLYLDAEMAATDVVERLAYFKVNNRPERLYIYSDAYANQAGLPRASLLNPKWRKTMQEFLLNQGIKLWVLDNIASLSAGIDENSKRDWDPVNRWLLDLRFAGIAIILLHHTNKEGGQRGTSAREDNLDISVTLQSPFDYTPEDGARFVVHFTKSRIRTADLPLITDTEFKLSINEDGGLEWTWSGVKKKVADEVLRLIDEGHMNQEDIAKSLNVTKGRVSQIKGQAIKDGYLTQNGKLTQSGYRMVFSDG